MCCFKQIQEASPNKKRLFGHLPSLSQNIQVKRKRYVGLLLMDTSVLVDQQEFIYVGYVRPLGVV